MKQAAEPADATAVKGSCRRPDEEGVMPPSRVGVSPGEWTALLAKSARDKTRWAVECPWLSRDQRFQLALLSSPAEVALLAGRWSLTPEQRWQLCLKSTRPTDRTLIATSGLVLTCGQRFELGLTSSDPGRVAEETLDLSSDQCFALYWLSRNPELGAISDPRLTDEQRFELGCRAEGGNLEKAAKDIPGLTETQRKHLLTLAKGWPALREEYRELLRDAAAALARGNDGAGRGGERWD